MKKLLFALPLVAGASWAGTTMYSGTQTHNAYDNLVAQLDELSTLTVESEAYNAGFMQSTAITRVMNASGPGATVLFRLQHVINHSPVSINDNGARVGSSHIVTTLITDDMSEDVHEFLAHFESGEAFVMHSQIGFSGIASNELILNRLSMDEDGNQINFDGGNYRFDYDIGGKLSGQGQAGTLTVNIGDAMMFEVSPSTASYDLDWVSKGIYSGTQDFNIPMVTMHSPDTGMDVTLNNMSITSETTISNGIVSGGASLSIASLDSPLPVTAASLTAGFDGFSLAGVENYTRIINSLMVSSEAEADAIVTMEQVGEAYKQLFNSGSSIVYALSLANDGGDMDASLKLKFIGDGSPGGSDNIATVGDLLRAMQGELIFDADAAALEQTPAVMLLMNPAVEAYVLNDGVTYSSNIKVADLIMDINGEPLSLELMLGDMLAMPLDFSMLAE